MNNAHTLRIQGILIAVAACMAAAVIPATGRASNGKAGELAMVTPEQATPGIALKLSESLANGHLLLEVRPRYTRITESRKPEKTDVWTLRTTLGWQTAPFYDLRLTAQYIYAGIIGPESLNADPARSGTSSYPLLPDPAHSGINQLFVDYSGLPSTRLRIGRQILRIDDQRFISDVDFRQTPQVFDGVTVVNTALPETEIQLGEYRRMRSVLGRTSNLRLHVLHAAWNPLPDHTLAAYGYWQDQAATGSQTGFSNNAQRIAGAHAEGGFAMGDAWQWLYYVAYARQSRIGGGDARIKAEYNRVGMGVQSTGDFGWGARLDHEIKGSNGGIYGFQTPLTDFYAFNGWALQYTSTPPQGLRDAWVTLHAKLDKLDCFAEAHRYRSDFYNLALGHEFDISLTYPLTHELHLKLQHARFRPGDGAKVKNDVDKTWLALTYKY